MNIVLSVLFGCCLLQTFEAKLSYSGYQLIKAYGNTPDDLRFIQEKEAPQRLVPWDMSLGEDGWAVSLTFHIHPEVLPEIKEELISRGLAYKVLSEDIQSDIDVETAENARAQSKPDDEWFESYHTYEQIMEWVDEQAVACGSACSTFSIGNSYEGRELKVLKLTGAPNGCEQKPKIWIDAGIHAREWIAHTTGQYLLDRLIQEYDTDAFVKRMRDTYDWYFLPIVNPDGYVYTHEHDRLWRKTRQPSQTSICVGADANRNFDFQWMTIGASSSPCSDTYAGSAPHSEPEAKAQAEFMMTLEGHWELFITLHTYSQLFMSPWGYTKELTPDHAELERVGRAAVQSIFNTHGKIYQFGNAASILYESSGTSRDWAKGVPQIPYVYTIELRSESSFVLPPSEIRPTGQEIWAALKTTVQRIQDVRPGNCISPRKGQ